MFRPMRRIRQQLSQTEAEAVMARGKSGILAVLGDGGYPYAVPLSYLWQDGRIYFHCAPEGHKLDAIRACDRVSFCVVDQDEIAPERFTTYFRSAIAFGRARIVASGEERRAAIDRLAEKYSPNMPEAKAAEIGSAWNHLCMVCIDVEHLTGKEAIELVSARPSENQ